MKYLLILLLISSTVFAEEYTTYNKVGVGYVFIQPSHIVFHPSGYKVDLYEGSNVSYHIERGIKVGNCNFGIGWHDALAQGYSRDTHRPYKLEVFGDHYWRFKYLDIKLGTGIKLMEDRTIDYTRDGVDYEYDQYDENGSLQARFTTRFSIGKQIGKYEVALQHHSQWLQGKPLNNKFEYNKTEISVSYVF